MFLLLFDIICTERLHILRLKLLALSVLKDYPFQDSLMNDVLFLFLTTSWIYQVYAHQMSYMHDEPS